MRLIMKSEVALVEVQALRKPMSTNRRSGAAQRKQVSTQQASSTRGELPRARTYQECRKRSNSKRQSYRRGICHTTVRE